MKKPMAAFINDLRSSNKLAGFDEASIKQGIVLRLLSLLGWDIFNVDDVSPNYAVNSRVISFALRVDSKSRVFIEVRGGDEKLEDHKKQLLAAAGQQKVPLCVLTNGAAWWLYLATGRGGGYKRFFACDFLKQTPDQFVSQLVDFLSCTKVAGGDALKSADAMYQSQKQKHAAEALPEAWNQLLAPPNKILVEILSESTERLCGHRADAKLVEKFIDSHFSGWLLEAPSGFKAVDAMERDDLLASGSDDRVLPEVPLRLKRYADKRIKSFGINGHTQNVRNWEEMLLSLCEFFAATHSQEFEKVLWISDDQQPYFSTYSDQLRIPEKIKKTNIYVETKLNPDQIVKIADDLLAEFGYGPDALAIATE